jgi:hypothetical protein
LGLGDSIPQLSFLSATTMEKSGNGSKEYSTRTVVHVEEIRVF